MSAIEQPAFADHERGPIGLLLGKEPGGRLWKRRVVEQMALCLQGSLLVRHAPAAVADAFCASRLSGEGGLEYGTLPAGSDFEGIIARGRPEQ